jgi:hypothetical protein
VDHLLKQSERITVILKPLKRVEDAERLLGVYMGRYRRQGSAFDALHPLDRGALMVLLDVTGGRPGPMLCLAHELIEVGGRNQWAKIGEPQARELTQDVDVEDDVPRGPRRRRIGAVE